MVLQSMVNSVLRLNRNLSSICSPPTRCGTPSMATNESCCVTAAVTDETSVVTKSSGSNDGTAVGAGVDMTGAGGCMPKNTDWPTSLTASSP